MNLYYLHFNNYYNRIVKKFDTLAEYLTLPYYDNVVTQNIAFNPNDGVDTKQIVNIPAGIRSELTYDYAILADGNDIVSRWFIIDANRTRNGQYNLSLRRDLFSDSLEGILDAPAFIEKAELSFNDPLIFNSENMTFNQIKTSETLLKDETSCPWIVGYIAREDAGGGIKSYSATTSLSTPLSQSVTSLSDWIGYNAYINNKPFVGPLKNYSFDIRYNDTLAYYSEQVFDEFSFTNLASKLNRTETDYGLNISQKLPNDFNWKSYSLNILNAFKETMDVNSIANFNSIASQNNTFIYDEETDRVYRIDITPTTITKTDRVNSSNNPKLFNAFNEPFDSGANNNSFGYSYSADAYNVSLTVVEGEAYSLTIPSNRYHLKEVPYDMFAIPYADGIVIKKDDAIHCNSTSKDVGLAIANQLSINFTGGGFLYDIQLLPYCPARFNIDEDGTINAVGDNATYGMFDILDSDNNVVSECFLCNSDSFSFNIALDNAIEITNPKIESQCNMYRICSPNYNGVFEFNAAKNGGVSYFNVDCTYKPYNPYIHINPNFGLLYGKDFNDSRGLIVGGDFSLPQISSAWTTYELNNKNYQNSFDRQIKNMEVNNAIQNIQTATQATLGVVSGIVGGFMAGGIGGAIAGGTASAVGGAVDYALQKAGQAEAIDYTKDQFGYTLGNIKAQATSISKTTAFVYNNKLFPFLEFYTCTDEEKVALENKIKYNGMTVMRIGTIREFLKEEPTYIKGKLIRVENIDEDFHYVNELANEFNKGVFI